MQYFIISMLLVGIACQNDDDTAETTAPTATGQALYESPHTDGNSYACATCHALAEPASDGLIRPGHPIGDASGRTSFKNGAVDSLLASVNSCRTEWMKATNYDEDDANWQALKTYLEDQAEGLTSTNISFTISQPPEDLSGGDKDRGNEAFNSTCAVCHGANATGTDQGPDLQGTTLTPADIAKRIRTSGPASSDVYDSLTGGVMPFWSAERLTDQQMIDIIAYLGTTEATKKDTGALDISKTDAQSSCGKTHAKVGQTLSFSTKSHKVAGTVTIIDDCTLSFQNFTYDGGGIDVQIYGGTDQNFSNSLSLSKDIYGTAYDQSSLTLRLPTGRTLDDFNSLSVWCVDVGISFGDGKFQ